MLEVEPEERLYHVEIVAIHPGYNLSRAYNDLALLKLSETIEFTPSIQPVCLTDQDFVAGTSCVAAGWGESEGKSPTHTPPPNYSETCP